MNLRCSRRSVLLVCVSLSMLGGSAFGAASSASGRIRYDNHKLVRVTVTSEQELERVLGIAADVWTDAGPGIGSFDLHVSPEQLAELQRAGIQHQVMEDNLQALIDLEQASISRSRAQPNDDWFATFHTYSEINDRLQFLASSYPDLATAGVIGQSLEGRDLWVIRVTGLDTPENPRDARSVFFIDGTQHAREWIAPMTVMFIVDQLLSQYSVDPRITGILDTVDFYIVPDMNPDGYEYTWTTDRYWRKNRRVNEGSSCRGVDLNRNWSVAWSGPGASSSPCSDIYYGASPFSEPETAVVHDFILTLVGRLGGSIDFHSFGRLVLESWQYTLTPPPDSQYLREVGQLVSDGIYSVHQTRYTAGQGSAILYIASGTAHDWAYGELGTTSFGIELRGNDFVIPPEQILPTGEENLEGTLRMVERLFLQ